MKKFEVPFWKEAPFIRIIIPFIAGIVISFYSGIADSVYIIITLISVPVLLSYSKFDLKDRFRFRYLNGVTINILIAATGAWVASTKNPYRNLTVMEHALSYSPEYGEPVYIVSLKEPPTEKKSSWKALCALESVTNSEKRIQPNTNIIVYFRKDSVQILPKYGNTIAFRKKPFRIKNFISTSAFDYERYCALKNIHYQVFIQPSDFVSLPVEKKAALTAFLYRTQSWVVGVLRKNIHGIKESGLAEALLIGYKNDLDKSLIQSYSNTGVVHVVAISGLHLGLIYSILAGLCHPLKGYKSGRIIRSLIIISGLWIFSLLAGGSPSVLRSAVMFSAIVTGETVSRRSSVLNNLASSAFFLLCYDPFWLWDMGFILSYSALLSILVFMKPIYNQFIFSNKIIDAAWKLNAVTLSAQILTMPVLIYYFKQFPNLFIITNFFAVPLSGIILTGELVLCAISFFPPLAAFTGKIVYITIRLMNSIVEFMDSLPFSSTRGLNINYVQLLLLYIFILFMARWLILKRKYALPSAIVTLITFFAGQNVKSWQ